MLTNISFQMTKKYKKLSQQLDRAEFYEPIVMEPFLPVDRLARFRYINGIALKVSCQIFKRNFGGSRPSAVFAWKIPEKVEANDHSARNLTAATKCISGLREVHSRARVRKLQLLLDSFKQTSKTNVVKVVEVLFYFFRHGHASFLGTYLTVQCCNRHYELATSLKWMFSFKALSRLYNTTSMLQTLRNMQKITVWTAEVRVM